MSDLAVSEAIVFPARDWIENSDASRTSSRVAVVIPVYKHPGLLVETLASALRQDTNFEYSIIIVNDGCPYEETDNICLEFAQRHPGKIKYIKTRNGGLSSARNTGIDFAINCFPELEAVYLLDADNRIMSMTLQKSLDMLHASSDKIGWIYPDITKFGIAEAAFLSGNYTVLEHLCWNFCEAGSMIRASIFREGLRYDEAMRGGYEDWEFWLQCIDAGYLGKHLPASGFLYRQRAESMLKDSERQHSNILSYIHGKHKSLFSPQKLIDLEEDAGGRYAVYCSDSGKIYRLTSVSEPFREASLQEFANSVSKSRQLPGFLDISPLVVVTSESVLRILRDFKLLKGVLWALERRVGANQIAEASIVFEPSDIPEVAIDFDGSRTQASPTHIAMIEASLLLGDLSDAGSNLLERASVSRLGLILRTAYDFPQPVPVSAQHTDLKRILDDGSTISSRYPTLRSNVQYQRRILSSVREYSHKVSQQVNVFPIKKDGQKDIGILLPVLSFGGVEKVALAYAQMARSKGARIHIVICGQNRALLTKEILDIASSLSFFDFDRTGANRSSYFGMPLESLGAQTDQESAAGLLCMMDAVINFNVVQFNGVMAQLRKMGIKTLTSQHLVDITPFGQPSGTPHQILAYEHAYDTIIVISEQLKRWFQAMGIPKEKLLLVRNGPGVAIPSRKRLETIQARESRRGTRLRVLFLGRFDRQKGLDRLKKVIDRCEEKRISVDWRLVGRAVLEDDTMDAAWLSKYALAPAVDAKTLIKHYAWADVLVLPSRFEGVPLSIIEAGMLGCVPLATDVGAVSELITDGVNGILVDGKLSEDQIVETIFDRLVMLNSDRDLRAALAKSAHERFSMLDWQNNNHELSIKMGL